MAVPVAIFVLCFAGGAVASGRWLPEVAAGRLGGIAFFAVSGLFGAALAVFGLQTYTLIDHLPLSGYGELRRDLLAERIQSILWSTGTLTALATVVLLLAPRAAATSSEVVPPPHPEPDQGL